MKKIFILTTFLISQNIESHSFKLCTPIFSRSISLGTSITEPRQHYEKFMQRYAPPLEFLDNQSVVTESIKDSIKKKTNLNLSLSLYVKNNGLSRVINAQRMQNCMNHHDLTNLDVAKKYVLLDTKNKTYATYVEHIEPIHDSNDGVNFSPELIAQLFTLTQHTGFADWHPGNWIFSKKNNGGIKLVCIDTEDTSFDNATFSNKHPFFKHYIERRYGCTEENFKYAKLKDMLGNKDSIESIYASFITKSNNIPLPHNPQYDDPDIDFELVKEHAAKISTADTKS